MTINGAAGGLSKAFRILGFFLGLAFFAWVIFAATIPWQVSRGLEKQEAMVAGQLKEQRTRSSQAELDVERASDGWGVGSDVEGDAVQGMTGESRSTERGPVEEQGWAYD